MDNARAHHDPRVRPIIERCGARLLYLPPYSPDLNPIEPAWALIKKEIKVTPHEHRLRYGAWRTTPEEKYMPLIVSAGSSMPVTCLYASDLWD
jgi:hypothetical protein